MKDVNRRPDKATCTIPAISKIDSPQSYYIDTSESSSIYRIRRRTLIASVTKKRRKCHTFYPLISSQYRNPKNSSFLYF
jgi:hypothetical protein